VHAKVTYLFLTISQAFKFCSSEKKSYICICIYIYNTELYRQTNRQKDKKKSDR